MYLSNPYIRINKLEIRNYRGIDELRIDFPRPVMDLDTDIMVIGGRNGIGKTSVLECSAILTLLSDEDEGEYFIDSHKITPQVNLSGLIIHSGADEAVISGEIEYSGEETKSKELIKTEIEIKIRRNNTINLKKKSTDSEIKTEHKYPGYNTKDKDYKSKICETNTAGYSTKKITLIKDISGKNEIKKEYYDLLNTICGSEPNPLIGDKCLFFHSLRRVTHGNPQLKDAINYQTYGTESTGRPRITVQNPKIKEHPVYPAGKKSEISSFKSEILRTIIKQTDIFEYDSKSTAENDEYSLNILNSLLKTFAGAKSGKLRPAEDNSIEIRITPLNGGEPYSIDSLGSGEKDIISTLFMIHKKTSENPAIVLIDEPEMHQNPGWHRSFMNRIIELAPDNQYIITTNSEYIMDSVEEQNRIILTSGKDKQWPAK